MGVREVGAGRVPAPLPLRAQLLPSIIPSFFNRAS